MGGLLNFVSGGVLGLIFPQWAQLNQQLAGISPNGSTAGAAGSSGSSGSQQPLTGLSYTIAAPAPAAAPWQGSAGAWAAIGIAVLVLLLLGSFDATRPLAIAVAIVLGAVMILGKVG